MRTSSQTDEDQRSMKILKPKVRNAGDKREIAAEERIEDVKFNVFKFNNRPKPTDIREILIIGCFSEFGCEIVGSMYCIPQLCQKHPGRYKIVMGWHGREYLYRHLVDEFWEIKEEHQWLREYCRAFHHESKNLTHIEKAVAKQGIVVPSAYLGQIAVGARCKNPKCQAFYGTNTKELCCRYCEHKEIEQSILGDVQKWKSLAKRIPVPSEEKFKEVDKYIKPNMVGVFARGRVCYGRNLSPEFYVKLITLLEDMGYNPIWLGEKQTTQPCPVDHIVDFSRMEMARDMETTLAIISKCEFTVQFWTASTRLAGMMGVPYLLFESPDQIWGQGQEGFRRNLCDFGPRKLSVNHFHNVHNDQDKAIDIVKECILEMQQGNYDDYFGLLENDIVARSMKKDNTGRIGG